MLSENRNQASQRWRARKFGGDEWAFENTLTNEYLAGKGLFLMFELRFRASNNDLVDGLNQPAVTSPLHPNDNQVLRWNVRKNTNVKPYVHTFYLRNYTERRIQDHKCRIRRSSG